MVVLYSLRYSLRPLLADRSLLGHPSYLVGIHHLHVTSRDIPRSHWDGPGHHKLANRIERHYGIHHRLHASRSPHRHDDLQVLRLHRNGASPLLLARSQDGSLHESTSPHHV